MSYILAISGASGSGKTTIAKQLRTLLSKEFSVNLMSQDDYYQDQTHLAMEDRLKTNYDHPDAFDQSLFFQHLDTLKRGQSIDKPTYCFETHTRLSQVSRVKATDIVIVEGLMIFNQPEFKYVIDLGLFIDTPLDICLLRRINRDIKQRGRSLKCVSEQYLATVRPMYMEHIKPHQHHADLRLSQFNNKQALIDEVLRQVQEKVRKQSVAL